MSAPMGVPTQRISMKPKAPNTLRPSPIPANSSKAPSNKSRFLMPGGASSDPVLKSATAKALSSRISSPPQVENSGAGMPVAVDKASRKIATNSRIKKAEQTKRDMYLAFVNNAMKAKSEGNAEPYNELLSQFSITSSEATIDYNQLQSWLLALSHVVSQLDKRHAALVEAITNMPWTSSPDENFVKAYISFFGMLVSARTEWMNLVVASVVRRLTHQSPLNEIPNQPSSSDATITLRTVFSRTHLLLQELLSLFPTLPSTLPTYLLRYFPHKSHGVSAHMVYCQNLIEIMNYCPQIVESTLSLIIERAIGIDVEIQVELEELEELMSSAENPNAESLGHGLLTSLDPFDAIAGNTSSSESGSDSGSNDGNVENFSDVSSEAEGDEDEPAEEKFDEREAARRAKRLRGMVAKLDGVMSLVLRWIKASSGSIPEEIATSAYQHPHFVTLLGVFDRTILTTFKSRYTQFIIFYIVSLPSFLITEPDINLDAVQGQPSSSTMTGHPNPHSDIFLGFLLHNTLVPQQPPTPLLTRTASASYMASFISRAMCVGKRDCQNAISVCCQWMTERVTELEVLITSNVEEGDFSMIEKSGGYTELAVFYAVAQTLFLVFCFRWRDLLEDGEDPDEEHFDGERSRRRWLRPLDIVQRLITSPLNPLKVCAPNVVHQFARVSQKVGFVYCQSIIEANIRAAKSSALSSNSPTTHGNTTPATQKGSQTQWTNLITSAAMKDLQAFFPFDPYRLPGSKKWFDGMYREWSMVAIDDDDDDEEEEEEEDDEEDDEGEGDVVADESGREDGSSEEGTEVVQGPLEDSEEGDGGYTYGAPMELGSTREAGEWDNFGLSEGMGKMSISPIPGGMHQRIRGSRNR